MSAIRLLQILALAAGAAAFAPYAGPDVESFEFVYQVPDGPALRIAGSKPRGRDAPAVVFLPYGIIPLRARGQKIRLQPTGLRRRLLRRPGRGISFLVRTARDCDPPQLVQQPDRRILRAGRDRSLAGR